MCTGCDTVKKGTLRVQLNAVLGQVLVQLLRAQHLPHGGEYYRFKASPALNLCSSGSSGSMISVMDSKQLRK